MQIQISIVQGLYNGVGAGKWILTCARRRLNSRSHAAIILFYKRMLEGVPSMAGKNLVLIVEDNEDFQDLYGMVAEMAGLEVERIYDGEVALQRLEREPIPAMLLLDTRLPRVGGIEILQAARSKEKWSRVPIYLMTADLRAAQSLNTIPAEALHADGVLEKGSDLIHKLRELFEKNCQKTTG